MIDSAVFIGAIIIAITQAFRLLSAKVNGIITMLVAVLTGIVVALVSGPIGLTHISVSQGILIALGSIGVHTVASSVSTNIKTPVETPRA
jgi:hypothetical protein